eukprot:scaffold2578_cov35-Attheya_sp.AAC.1
MSFLGSVVCGAENESRRVGFPVDNRRIGLSVIPDGRGFKGGKVVIEGLIVRHDTSIDTAIVE